MEGEQESQEPVIESQEAPEQTVSLEDVYSEFNVSPQIEPQANQQAVAPQVEYDDIYSEVGSLKQELEQIKTQAALNAQKQMLERDIQEAVKKVGEGLDADPLIIEAAMDAKARKDPRFQAVWNNRHSNPAMYEKALTAFRGEIAKSLRVKESPQIAETLAAVENSNVSAPEVEAPNEFESASDGAFSRKWRELTEA